MWNIVRLCGECHLKHCFLMIFIILIKNLIYCVPTKSQIVNSVWPKSPLCLLSSQQKSYTNNSFQLQLSKSYQMVNIYNSFLTRNVPAVCLVINLKRKNIIVIIDNDCFAFVFFFF